jgi:hypothetical protein
MPSRWVCRVSANFSSMQIPETLARDIQSARNRAERFLVFWDHSWRRSSFTTGRVNNNLVSGEPGALHPKLRICVPHLGFDEITEYRNLIEKYDTLWLDTTMVLTDYFPIKEIVELKDYRLQRIMYGSDFPNIPYAWDRELKWLAESGLPLDDLEWILNKSACDFFNMNL